MKNKILHTFGKYLLMGVLWLLAILFTYSSVFAQGMGMISGKATDAKTNEALSSINVRVKGTTLGAITDPDGKYTVRNVPVGTYTIIFSAIGYTAVQTTNVEVKANETTIVNGQLTAEAIPVSETIVYGASLRPERITEAPAAVSVIGPEEIKEHGSHGQLPRLLETVPGVDIVQSGVQDFNINTRGFNKSINRRLLVLMDGRDMAIVLLGVQEWNGLSVPLEDLGRVELVRGPGSALYGANAYNGVISITTLAPKEILGTKIVITGGELATFRGDIRHAGVSGDWSYKFNLGGVRSDTWSRSRKTLPLEYPGLAVETRSYDVKQVSSIYGSARVDRDFEEGAYLTFETGMTQVENDLFLTGIGRVHVPKARKPWGRVAYASEHFFAQVWGSGRSAIGAHYSLLSGAPLKDASENFHMEFQHNFSALDNQLRVVWGASHRYQHENTEGTLMPSPRWDNSTGLFAQAEYKFTDEVKGVIASRYDRSTLYKASLVDRRAQFSPKAALVVSPTKDHSFRLTFNRAFQVPNYSELFLRADAAPPVDLRALNAGYKAFTGVDLGLGITRVLALGNNNLNVERILGFEAGYKGIYEKKLFVTADIYYNKLKDFVTALLPNVNPAYPNVAFPTLPSFPAGDPRAAVVAQLAGTAAVLRSQGLASLPDGSRAIVVSYTNAGEVNERGFEVSGKFYLTDEISADLNWSYFDFEVKSQLLNDRLFPNTPKHKVNFGLSYAHRAGYTASLTAKWVKKYYWAGGVFNGDVPEYTLVNLVAGYQLTKNVHIGANVYNLLDRKHYEIFGGSVLERRILGTITTTF